MRYRLAIAMAASFVTGLAAYDVSADGHKLCLSNAVAGGFGQAPAGPPTTAIVVPD